ncbi:MAG: hypothetical protein ACKO24_12575 [Leptolyngbyaceae cyanobacterium]
MKTSLKVAYLPLLEYLKQPLFDPQHKLILNPRRFWYFQNVAWLERCAAMACTSQSKGDS